MAPAAFVVSPELLSALSCILEAVSLAREQPQHAQQAEQGRARPEGPPPASPPAEQTPLLGRVALHQLSIQLVHALAWAGPAPAGCARGEDTCGRCASPSAEMEVEECVVLLQQALISDGRPWLAGAAARATQADASVMGLSLTIQHPGRAALGSAFQWAAAALVLQHYSICSMLWTE